MKLDFKYAGSSGILSDSARSRVAFATNQLREATYFDGELARPLVFREALGALYDVVVSDHRYHPKDRLAFRAWLEAQDQKFLDSLFEASPAITARIEALEARLSELNAARDAVRRPFFTARQRYVEYLYENQYELEVVLDPVITVHPDELSFEAFSRDESTYARLSARHDLFARIDAAEHGTTNVDFGLALHAQLDRMRSYRATRFTIDPGGITVQQAGHAAVREKKIELPDSWLAGFLQVHAVSTMGLTRIALAPIDVHNVLRFLRRHRARTSPRALRWELRQGRPTRVVLEPWEHAIELSPASVYEGEKDKVIRTWGRDRLQVLERVVPVSERIDVYLAGTGLPSFWVCELGDLVFTLGLSGWTDNDWAGGTKLDLLSTPTHVTAAQLGAVYEGLRAARYATDAALASTLSLGLEDVRSALAVLCRSGRAMVDLASGVHRHRDLLLEPFQPAQALAQAKKDAETSDPKAKIARQIVEAGDVRIIARRPVGTGYKISGSAKGPDGARVRPLVGIDQDGQITEATCTCAFGSKHGLTQGPCEHMLALRLVHLATLKESLH